MIKISLSLNSVGETSPVSNHLQRKHSDICWLFIYLSQTQSFVAG